MGKALISFPNRLASASYSGGLWSTTLPVTHLATRQLAQVARTRRTDARTTYAYADAGSAVECAVAALAGHNLSSAGKWRLRGFASDPRPAAAYSFRDGALPSGVSFARSTVATYIGTDGLLKTAAVNEPRWVLSGAKVVGVQCEPASTNMITQCRVLSTASLVRGSLAATATGIDGTANSAATFTASFGANAQIKPGVSGTAAGSAMVFSCYLRRRAGTGNVRITVNNFAASTVVTLTSSWQRFSVSAVGSQPGIQLDTAGDAVDIDFCQFEDGGRTYPSSAIATTTTAVTRASDVMTIAAPATDPTDGAIVLDGVLTTLALADTTVLSAVAGTSRADYVATATGAIRADYITSSTTQASITSAALSAGATFAAAITWAADDVRFAVGGTLGTPDTTATMGTGTSATITIGGAGTGDYVISELRTYGTAFATADLQSITGAEGERVASIDSGQVDAYPSAWISATTAEQQAGVRYPSPWVAAAPASARYWRIDLIDEANAAGYLQAGRVFIGGAVSTALNAQYGATLGYRDRSSSVETHSGAEYFDDRPQPREMALTWPALTDSEALLGMLELQRQQGTTREVLAMWDRADTTLAPVRTFLGRLTGLSPVRAAAFGVNEASVAVKELL